MSASLVGSEMCIRDRLYLCCCTTGAARFNSATPLDPARPRPTRMPHRPVSYTHLTLPTICSV
eukprot:1415913-Alexandrium_andersonii.AAC.1